MKPVRASTRQPVPKRSTSSRGVLRFLLAALGWVLFTTVLVLTGYLLGWILLTLFEMRSSPAGAVRSIFFGLLGTSIVLSWLVARLSGSWRSILLVTAIVLGIESFICIGFVVAWPDGALYLARIVAWGRSTVQDADKFPVRVVNKAPPVYHYSRSLSPELFPTVEYKSDSKFVQADLEEFLYSTQTTSFIVIKDDAILYEEYFNGYSRESVVTSFSIAKSFTSALIGIAIDEGYIASVEDPVIKYLPELKGRKLDELTIRQLLNMSTGIKFVPDDQVDLLGKLTQFSDGQLAYYYPDLRGLALEVEPDGEKPGTAFNYNKYHPLLLGMILERATGMPVTKYLEEKLWQPLGMEYPATWSLDSESDGFEKMESGINARAIDFAKFGSLFLHNGNWNGTQLISEDWVRESTSPDPDDFRSWHSNTDWKQADGYYKYMWWGRRNGDGSYDYAAQGQLGQWIYVSPHENMVIVRFGLDDGGVDSWADVFQSLIEKASQTIDVTLNSTQDRLLTSTPEEQGLDSGKLADGLLALKEKGTPIHSLMIVRNDSVVLDADFYPYDGSIYHDLASVTKSVMTTLIGIAIDQGRLKLDDPMLLFFPDRKVANLDERKQKITVRHLLSMSAGLDCDPLDDEMTMVQMRASQDWVQFALDLPVVSEPGTKFLYCSPEMHLLSAILEKATGTTALDFARLYLFEPLGIQDVYWPSDPQGITHGWGDLALRPQDMAKLGALFLHQGQWGDQQIVSSDWVAQATQSHMTGTGKAEDYGFGWWISPANAEWAYFLATGNGGQKIRVIPPLNMIVVTTGAGVEPEDVEPYILDALADQEKPLPANPAALERLNAALQEVVKGPEPQPVPPPPDIANEITGQRFVFASNRVGLISLQLDFDGSPEAKLTLDVANEPGARAIVVGLDGLYRPSRAGRPIISKGNWADPETFVIDYNEGPGLAQYTVSLRFVGDTLIFDAPGLGRFQAKKQS